MPHFVASDPDLHCLPMSHKKDARHIWVNHTHIVFSNNMKNVLCLQVSLASIIADAQGAGNFSAFRALRTLRAFRPLRAISRWQGMKVILFSPYSAKKKNAPENVVC